MIMTFPLSMLKGAQGVEYNEYSNLPVLPKLTVYDDHFTIQIPREELWDFQLNVGAHVAYYRQDQHAQKYAELLTSLKTLDRALDQIAYELADAEEAEQET